MSDLETLARNHVDLHPAGGLEAKLALGRPLRVKLGIDVTAPDIHIGRAIPLQRMRAFQDAGRVGALSIGDVRLDPERHEVRVRGQVVTLPLKEFELLELLMERAGRVVTRDSAIAYVWGDDYVGDTKTLDVHINRLRKKVDSGHRTKLIHTVRGVGYVVKA